VEFSSKSNRSIRVYAVIALLASLTNFVDIAAHATGFQQMYLRLDRLATSTTTGGLVCAQPTTTNTEAKVLLTFPTGFTVNGTAANWTVTTTNLPTGATAWTGITTATNVTGQVVTFGSGDLTVGTLYCFNFAASNTLTNPATAGNSLKGNIVTQTSGSVVMDQTYYGLSIISDDTITVTAVVPPIFIFTLDANADTFPSDLDPATVNSTAGRLVTITTNSKGGWITWAKDSQQGLYSSTTNYKINTSGTVDGTPSTVVPGAEGYVLDTNITLDAAGGCTVNIAGEYNGTGANQGGTFSSLYQPIASCTGASPATANGDQISLIERATIAGSTPAGGDYSDIITVVAAGNF
jgi:hypothetical protein